MTTEAANRENTEKKLDNICRKFDQLEQHIFNLIFKMQDFKAIFPDTDYVSKLAQRIQQVTDVPIKIDDRNLCAHINELKNSMNEFTKANSLNDLIQTLNEIKYMGKRLLEIERTLARIEASGIKNDVVVSIRTGNENEFPQKNDPPFTDLESIIGNLTPRKREIFDAFLKYGFDRRKIAAKVNITPASVTTRKTYFKRYLRWGKRPELISKLSDAKVKSFLMEWIK